MDRTMRKRVFGHMQIAKAQISLRIRAVWSGPSLSAKRIVGNYRIYFGEYSLYVAAHAWDDPDSVHFAHARRHIFVWRPQTAIQYARSISICGKQKRSLFRKTGKEDINGV